MASRTRSLGLLSVLLAACHGALGQSCWRNTTCSSITETAWPGEWEANNFSPDSRTVAPASILSLSTGDVTSLWPGTATLASNGSNLVFDFGKEVGGIVSIAYAVRSTNSTGNGTGTTGSVGLAFTEAKNWIGEWSDSSNGAFSGPDGALYSDFAGEGPVAYAMPTIRLRGGFRYLTLFLVSQTAAVDVTDISLEIGFQPTWSNLRAYQGYFHSDDDELNKIWYSGAYTLQTNAVPVNTGRQASPFLKKGWANNGTLGTGETTIVDGAKRDRAVWPGDMGIAVPSTFVSVGDLESVQNALQVMYDYQNSDGSFPECGPPLLQQNSDTYHMWTMIGTYNYVLYTNDTSFLEENWDGYLRAMNYIYAKVLTPGLLNVTGTRDWARWATGWNMSEAQMILYQTLNTGASLATWLGDTSGLAATWTARATALQNTTLAYCWDASYGAFKDNATATTVHPQDANSMALLFGLVNATSATGQSISERLTDNWTPIGANAPELTGSISPFISSFEIQGHLTAGQTERALDLIRRSWGWYLNNPNGSQSTVIEGYLTDGTFGYRYNRGYSNDYSYISHAHGWSSGPTSALTEFVLGLAVMGPAGSAWRFAPQFANLTDVQGGFVTALGKYQAHWTTAAHGNGTAYNATVSTPAGTAGQFVLPVVVQNVKPRVVVDGKTVAPSWYRRGTAVQDLVVVENVAGGDHTIEVS